jgi:hypothetical protein
MIKQVGCVQTFKNYRVPVGQKMVEKCCIPARYYDKGLTSENVEEVQVALVIMNLEAFAFQCPRTGATVTETVQDHSRTQLLQGCYFIENVDDPAVIRRIGNVEADEVNYFVLRSFVHEGKNRLQTY